MNELDKIRTDHSYEMLMKGRLEVEIRPELGFYWIWSSRTVLISMTIKNSGAVPTSDIVDFIAEVNSVISKHKIDLHVEKQNDLMILALAAGDVRGAASLAQLKSREDTLHAFDRLLNHQLRMSLDSSLAVTTIEYKPTKAEIGLFEDICKIRESKYCDFNGVNKYWQTTRNRRYANTVFQHVNLFHLALHVLQSHITKHCTEAADGAFSHGQSPTAAR